MDGRHRICSSMSFPYKYFPFPGFCFKVVPENIPNEKEKFPYTPMDKPNGYVFLTIIWFGVRLGWFSFQTSIMEIPVPCKTFFYILIETGPEWQEATHLR